MRWVGRILRGNVELLRNVRSFRYPHDSDARFAPYWIASLHLYLPSLCRLESLGLYSVLFKSDILQTIGIFSAFRQTLSSLSLVECRTTSNALITIINYFPLLVNLDLQALTRKTDRVPVSQLSRPLRGRLVIADCGTNNRAPFDKLSNPSPELDELILRQVHMPIFYDCLVGVNGGSVKHLEMHSRSSERESTS